MLMTMIQVHVTRAMLSKCTRSKTGMMRRSCGFVATKMETTYGNLSMVCILVVKQK